LLTKKGEKKSGENPPWFSSTDGKKGGKKKEGGREVVRLKSTLGEGVELVAHRDKRRERRKRGVRLFRERGKKRKGGERGGKGSSASSSYLHPDRASVSFRNKGEKKGGKKNELAYFFDERKKGGGEKGGEKGRGRKVRFLELLERGMRGEEGFARARTTAYKEKKGLLLVAVQKKKKGEGGRGGGGRSKFRRSGRMSMGQGNSIVFREAAGARRTGNARH